LHSGHDLDLPEARELEAHLTGCSDCQVELDAFREARTVLLDVRESDVVASGIWQALAPRLDAVDATKHLQRPWYVRPSGVLRIAAALLVLASLPFLLPNSTQPGGGAPSVDSDFAVGPTGARRQLIEVPTSATANLLVQMAALPDGGELITTQPDTVTVGNFPRF
jgi:anti-sigma factor RsiW